MGEQWSEFTLNGGICMLIGEYNLTLDDRGRIIIPSKLRSDLEDSFVMTKGLDGCIFVYPKSEWEVISKKVRSLPLSSKEARAFQRSFYSKAVLTNLDKQGRVLIPQSLRDHSGLIKDGIIVGLDVRAEIWSLEKWQEMDEDLESSYEDNVMTLGGEML